MNNWEVCMNPSDSVLFIFIGNYLGKLRRNFWAGIRTPWTLASDVVWERTHRFGGWLFVIGGLLGVIMSFISVLRVWGFIVVVVAIVVILYAYNQPPKRCVRSHRSEEH